MSESHLVVSNSLQPHGLYSRWNSPGQNTGVGISSLLQGIFPTQGSNPGLPHCRQILYQLSHKGSPRILEWVPYPFSSTSSWLRNQTWISCIAGRFFTRWTTREAKSPECHFDSVMFIMGNDLTAKNRATLLMRDKILIWISGFSFLKPQEFFLQESEQQNQELHWLRR